MRMSSSGWATRIFGALEANRDRFVWHPLHPDADAITASFQETKKK